MKLISHRGNTQGPNGERENNPEYLDEALGLDFDVEVDVWVINNELFLGHDEPQYPIEFRWIRDRMSRLWVHCKNLESLYYFKQSEYPVHYFWHQEDDFTLTSRNLIWTYPKNDLTLESICVMPEWDDITNKEHIPNCYGVCSDYISNFK